MDKLREVCWRNCQSSKRFRHYLAFFAKLPTNTLNFKKINSLKLETETAQEQAEEAFEQIKTLENEGRTKRLRPLLTRMASLKLRLRSSRPSLRRPRALLKRVRLTVLPTSLSPRRSLCLRRSSKSPITTSERPLTSSVRLTSRLSTLSARSPHWRLLSKTGNRSTRNFIKSTPRSRLSSMRLASSLNPCDFLIAQTHPDPPPLTPLSCSIISWKEKTIIIIIIILFNLPVPAPTSIPLWTRSGRSWPRPSSSSYCTFATSRWPAFLIFCFL